VNGYKGGPIAINILEGKEQRTEKNKKARTFEYQMHIPGMVRGMPPQGDLMRYPPRPMGRGGRGGMRRGQYPRPNYRPEMMRPMMMPQYGMPPPNGQFPYPMPQMYMPNPMMMPMQMSMPGGPPMGMMHPGMMRPPQPMPESMQGMPQMQEMPQAQHPVDKEEFGEALYAKILVITNDE
jgi:hypothetical protein